MQSYIAKRMLGMALNLVLVSLFIFAMLQLVPGDIAAEILGDNTTPEQYATFREQHHLDDSVLERYWSWAGDTLQGDFGHSLRSNFTVTKEFWTRFPITFEIVVMSFFFTTVMGVSFGILSAVKQNSFLDYAVRLFSTFSLSIPGFLLLTLLLVIPSRCCSYAPPFGATDFLARPWDNLRLFLPPTFVLAVGGSGGLMRLTRTAFLDVLRQDYMRTARAKGLPGRQVIMRHGFRNTLAPVLTLAGLQLSGLLGGSVIVESVMGMRGLGTWALSAIQAKDYPIVMVFSLYIAILVMGISLIIDIFYAVFDPRVRYT